MVIQLVQSVLLALFLKTVTVFSCFLSGMPSWFEEDYANLFHCMSYV